MSAKPSRIGHHTNRQNFPGKKPHRVAPFEGGWSVLDADGVRVSKRLQLREYANDLRRQMDADLTQIGQKGVRACMCCQTAFKSEGPHNRLCDTCRRHPDTDMVPHRIAGRRG
jgi:uncharacterized paraquat-inducible protein A